MASKYFVTCPNCGAKLITVCSGENTCQSTSSL